MPNRPKTHKVDRPKPRRDGRRVYNRQNWRRIRARFLADNPACSEPGCGMPSTEVDHKNGDPNDNRRTNLRAYCKSHHSRKTYRHDGSFGRRVNRLEGEEE